MIRKALITMLTMAAVACLISPALAGAHGDKRPVKKAILLVAFGTSIPEARVAFDNIGKQVARAFPGVPVRWAYTSSIIRRKLAKQGTLLDSPEGALAKMMDEGFTHLAVQSLHTIAGEEFHHLRQNAHAFGDMAEGFDKVIVGAPLLTTQADIEMVSDALIQNIPAERKPGEAVVLMGHGSHHPANAFYAALAYSLQQRDPYIFVGTVEGFPKIGDIKITLKQKSVKKAYLVPFMSVAGDHARNDLAGDAGDSWKSILTGAGIQCEVLLKGTAEYDNMVAIWVEHLKKAFAHLKE
ncbi:sirohydrochlorin cobaltochelatase [Thermodesulfobacteriota bacterium]